MPSLKKPAGAPVRAVALVVVWSSGFIGAEIGTRHAPPDTLLSWRFLAATLILLPALRRAVQRLDRREWVRQGVLALLCQCLYLGGVFWAASAGVPAGTSALIASLQPALVLIAGALLQSQRLRLRQGLGLALGTAGVAVTAASDLSAGTAVSTLFLPLAGMLCLTTGTLLQQRWSSPLPVLETLAVQATFSAVSFTAYSVAAGDLKPPASAAFWFAVAWAVVAGLGSFGFYYLVIARDGAARASVLLYLTPAATAFWAVAMLGQPLRVVTVLGLVISASAVLLLHDNPDRGQEANERQSGSAIRADFVPEVSQSRQRQRPAPPRAHTEL
jgi:drug/metabolite transporter (DMT)-like permease